MRPFELFVKLALVVGYHAGGTYAQDDSTLLVQDDSTLLVQDDSTLLEDSRVCLPYVVSHSYDSVPLTLDYVVITPDNDPGQSVIRAQVSYRGQGYIAFAISPDGGMDNSLAVIGLPDEGTVAKYSLDGEATDFITALDDEQQTLFDTSIEQNATHTTLLFTKYLDELNEIPISLSAQNYFIVAGGLGNTLDPTLSGYRGTHRFDRPISCDVILQTVWEEGAEGEGVEEEGTVLQEPAEEVAEEVTVLQEPAEEVAEEVTVLQEPAEEVASGEIVLENPAQTEEIAQVEETAQVVDVAEVEVAEVEEIPVGEEVAEDAAGVEVTGEMVTEANGAVVGNGTSILFNVAENSTVENGAPAGDLEEVVERAVNQTVEGNATLTTGMRGPPVIAAINAASGGDSLFKKVEIYQMIFGSFLVYYLAPF